MDIQKFIIDNYPDMNKKDIAEAIGEPLSKVQWIIRKLGLKRWQHNEWTREEELYLIANYATLGSKVCGSYLKRSYMAVQKKAAVLGIKVKDTAKYYYIDGDGYIVIRKKRTESAKRLHRVLMEEHLGRKLMGNEVVHHIDRNKLNNEMSNLVVMTRAEHINEHRNDLCSV